MSRRVWLCLLLASPLLMANNCKKEGEEDRTEGEVVDAIVGRVEDELQVSRVLPASVAAGEAFTVTVYGSAFVQGAKVSFGGTAASRVEWRDENTLSVTGPPLPDGSVDITVFNPDGVSATLRRGLSVGGEGYAASGSGTCRNALLFFDYNSYALTSEAERQVAALVPCLQGRSGTIRLEGHADERGTTEYNLALGQRRAEAVEKSLATQGVAPGRLRSVSYGEEQPVATGTSELAHSRNRRVELKAE